MNNQELIINLEKRFNENMHRHANSNWNTIFEKLNNDILFSLKYMEETGGEPDVIIYQNSYWYCDCSKESPLSRRNLCYDNEALDKRKNNKPMSSALSEATKNNIRLLSEIEYKYLQSLEDFDLKSSNWLLTENEVRLLGGAIFGDKRYGRTFIYHNSAESYYSSRGFRGIVKISDSKVQYQIL